MKNLLYRFLDKLIVIENNVIGKKKWLSGILNKESNQLILILLFYTLLFILISFSLFSVGISFYVIFTLLIVLFFVIIKALMIWRERQIEKGITKIRRKEKLKNFNLSITSIILEKLHYNLCKHNVIEEYAVKKSSFLKIFLDDFDSHSEVIDFQLELAQIKYLFEKIIKTDTLIKSNRFINGSKILKFIDFEQSGKFTYKKRGITSKQLSDNFGKAKKDNPTKLLKFQESIDRIFNHSLDI